MNGHAKTGKGSGSTRKGSEKTQGKAVRKQGKAVKGSGNTGKVSENLPPKTRLGIMVAQHGSSLPNAGAVILLHPLSPW